MDVHRMLVPWDESSTWNSFPNGGVSTTGTEAAREADFSVEPNAANAPALFAVTQTVQSWVNGQPNFGWLINTDGTNGWGWNSSEAADLTARPRLEVDYFSPAELMAGDANQDLSFDQLDLVQVLQAGKYLTRESATWGEGDWNGRRGATQGILLRVMVCSINLISWQRWPRDSIWLAPTELWNRTTCGMMLGH